MSVPLLKCFEYSFFSCRKSRDTFSARANEPFNEDDVYKSGY